MGLRAISLCAGGGGLDLGLRIAVPDARTVCYVEREAYAVAVLVSRIEDEGLDDAPIWTDLTTFDGRAWRGAVDLVMGGIPCQPFSVAGKRMGKDDPRDLWPHALRIVEESQPRFVFIENVAGSLSGLLCRIADDLEGLGYRVAAGIFSAEEVGAPHRRERLFVLADAGIASDRPGADARAEGGIRPETGLEECGAEQPIGVGRRMDDGGVASGYGPERSEHQGRGPAGEQTGSRDGLPCGPELADTEHALGEGGREQGRPDRRSRLPLFPPGPSDAEGWRRVLAIDPGLAPATQCGVRLLADGLAPRLEQLRLLGNGVVPLTCAYAFCSLAACLEE